MDKNEENGTMNHSYTNRIARVALAIAVAASVSAAPLVASADQTATAAAAQTESEASSATTVTIDKRWKATDEQNAAIIEACKKAKLKGADALSDYLKGRYATSTSYSRTLKAYIDAYDLTEYDKPVEEAKKDVALDKVLTPAAMHTVSTPTLDDFRVSVPEPGLPARQANPVVSGLLAALAAAAAGALGFWMYWRRKVVRESAAARAGAHATPEAETARPLDAAWLAEVTGIADETPAHAKAPAHAAKPAHTATPADSESPTKPLSLE